MRVHGPALEAIMERSGYSASKFAVEVGISHAYLSQMINGKRPGTPGVITKMSAALGCPLAAIIRDDAPEEVSA